MTTKNDAAIARQVAARRKLKRQYSEVFGGPSGCAVLAHMCNGSGVITPLLTMTPDGHYDPLKAAYNEGKRVAMLDVLGILNYEEVDPQELIKRLKPDAE